MVDCLFCKIAAHTIPVMLLHEDDESLAFADTNPQAPTHMLLIPKQHFTDVTEAPPHVLGALMNTASKLARQHLPDGFRLVVNTGREGGQTVPHLHLHVLGGRPMSWPPG